MAHIAVVVASVILIRCDLSRPQATRQGRDVLIHIPPSAQALRYLGQALAWYARPTVTVGPASPFGHGLIAAGWSYDCSGKENTQTA